MTVSSLKTPYPVIVAPLKQRVKSITCSSTWTYVEFANKKPHHCFMKLPNLPISPVMNRSLNLALVFSIAFHVLLVATLSVSTYLSGRTSPSDRAIEIAIVDSEPTENEIKNNAKLVVESDHAAANEKVDEKAKYLSEKNNTVVKETRAKSGEKFVNAKTVSAKTKPIAESQQQKSAKAKKSEPNLFLPGFDAYSALNKNSSAQQESKRQIASGASEQGSTTNDNLKNLESDLITRLNTREYKYYGYYTRIKNQLNQWWVPQVQQKFTKMLKQGRSIASEESKVTKLVIVLNEAGNLIKVQVLAQSGVRDLDDAAVEAFRQAAPFPNPPKGMVEKDGTVKIRWDCVVES